MGAPVQVRKEGREGKPISIHQQTQRSRQKEVCLSRAVPHLIRPERDPLADQNDDVPQDDRLVQVVVDVGDARGRLVRPVRVGPGAPAAPPQEGRQVRRRDVRDVLALGDARHLLVAVRGEHHEQAPPVVPVDIQDVGRRAVGRQEGVHGPAVGGLDVVQKLLAVRVDAVGREGVRLVRRQLQGEQVAPLDQVVDVVPALLRKIEVDPPGPQGDADRREVEVEHLIDHALVDEDQQGVAAHPQLVAVDVVLGRARVEGDQVQEAQVVLAQVLLAPPGDVRGIRIRRRPPQVHRRRARRGGGGGAPGTAGGSGVAATLTLPGSGIGPPAARVLLGVVVVRLHLDRL